MIMIIFQINKTLLYHVCATNVAFLLLFNFLSFKCTFSNNNNMYRNSIIARINMEAKTRAVSKVFIKVSYKYFLKTIIPLKATGLKMWT